ncbi:MAG: type II toxin-antitoxin system VapB family antitoxin [Terrimicrobiaceae bacterium]
MKTTLDIPEPLITEAIRLSGAKTKRAAVLKALEEYTRRAGMKALARTLGDSDSFMDHEQLMALRAQET